METIYSLQIIYIARGSAGPFDGEGTMGTARCDNQDHAQYTEISP